MKKLDYYEPILFFKRNNDCDKIILIAGLYDGSFKNVRMFRIDKNIQTLNLSFSGFDTIFKNREGRESVVGDVFLNLTNNEVQSSIHLAELDLSLSTKRKGKSESSSQNLINIREEIKKRWQESFSENYIEDFGKSNFLSSNGGDTVVNKNWLTSKNILVLLTVLVVFVLLFKFVTSDIKLNTQAAQPESKVSTDPKVLAQNQKEALDQTFKELNIDRNKITSDMSCFQE